MDATTTTVSFLVDIGALSEADRIDHIDIHAVRGAVGLRPFVAGMIGHRPVWLRGLYRLRAVLARLLGLEHVPSLSSELRPEDVPMHPGERYSFLTVVAASDNGFWVASGADRHLRAVLGIVATPEPDGTNRFAIVTVVTYRHWTGPLYFNLIRPFHHLVVWGLARAAAKG